MTPLLSICIPTYNRVGTLRNTLNSIISQVASDTNVEILVCDNASTDSTVSLVSEYMNLYPQIRYHRNQTNAGFDGNIVACLQQARGEYVSFFSDDDIALPGTFSKIIACINESKPLIIYLNHFPFFNNNINLRLRPKHLEADIRFTSGKDFLLYAGLGFISSLTIKREFGMEFIPSVKYGVGQAHLDIAARVALSMTGTFLFAGTCSIAARVPITVGYDEVTFAAINEAVFYHSLEHEGWLDSSDVRRRMNKSIRKNLFRSVLRKKCSSKHNELALQKKTLIETYGRYPLFFLYIYPILVLPRVIFLIPFQAIKSLLLVSRYIKLICTENINAQKRH